MIKEIAYGLAGNFIFSLMLFGYKRYHHEHYDEIIKRLILIETQLKPINNDNIKPINNDNINKKYF